MEFSTEAHKVCYEKIAGLMKELFGEFPVTREDAPVFGMFMGSALVQVAVYAWGDEDAIVGVRSYVVTDVELVPDLMRFLLQENASMRFGAFGADDDDDIFFEHTIVGSTCDKGELKASVLAVLKTADEYDDRITGKWGGQRARDRVG